MNSEFTRNTTIAYFTVTIENGGAENLLLRLCTEFQKKSKYVKPTIVAFKKKDDDLLKSFMEINIPVTYLNINSSSFTFYDFLKVIKWIRSNRPAILHTHAGAKMDKFILFAATLCGIKKKYCTIHNMDQNNSYRARLSYKLISLLSTKLIAVSESAKSFYSTNNFFDNNKLTVITNCPGFEAKFVKPKVSGLKSKKIITLVNIGGLRPQKGQIFLIRALDILKSSPYMFQLNIIGDDRFEYGSVLMKEIVKFQLQNVNFLGNRRDIESELSGADILVASSIKEAFHMVVIEAMSVGVPIIASNILPHKEIFATIPEAVLVEAANPTELADGILKLVENENLYIQLSRNEIDRSKDYSANNTIKKHLELYRESN